MPATVEIWGRERPPFTVPELVLGTIALFFLSNLGALVVLGLLGHEPGDDIPIRVGIVAQLPLYACLVGIPWFLHLRAGGDSLVDELRLRFRWVDVPVGIAAGLATQIGVLVFVPLYDLLGVDQDKVGEAAEELADSADDPLGVALLVVMAVVAAAVLEEVFYRGMWLRGLERRISAAVAIGVTAAVFALLHFQPYDFLPLFTFGVVAGVLAHRAGRIGPAVFAHFGFNAIALVFLLAG